MTILPRATILFLTTVLLAALPGRLLAQSQFIPRFQHFGVEEGLSQSSSVCLAQDHEGFLWVGTYAGLNRFDGYGFKIYASDQNAPGSLVDSNIRALMVDDAGTLWVGTRNGGLSRHDAVSDTFVNFLNDPSDPASIPSNEVQIVHQDSRGVIRVGTAAGMAEIQKSTGAFRPIPQASDTAKGNKEIVSITEDDQGRIWAASRHMVFRLDQTAGVLVPVVNGKLAEDLLQAEINQVFPEGRDVLWLACDVSGIFRLDLNSGRVERHLATTGVFKLLRDRWGALWAATARGVGRLVEKGESRHFELFPHNSYDPDTVSQNDVISLLEDDSGILWAGTYSGGLNKLIPGSRWFASYRHIPGDPGSLPGKEVSAVCPGRDGSLWVGMRYAGLVRMDQSRAVIERFVHDPANPKSLAENQVNCVMEDSRGRIWVGTVESGISVLDRSTGTFTQFRHDPNDPRSLSQDKIWWLLEDKGGLVWAGTSKGGLNRLDPATGTVTRYRNDPRNPSSISHDRVRHIMQSHDGALWIGTNAGLNRFDPTTETFTHWLNDPKDPESLSNDRVTPIVEDPSGLLWVGTDSGLNRFDPATGKFRRYTVHDGLADDGIQGMAMDDKGRLWMSTFKGISRLDPASGEIRNYTRRDGLVGVEFYMNAFSQSASGEMFFGGFSGINAFFPEGVTPNLHAPPVALTGLLVNNQPRALLCPADPAKPGYGVQVKLSPTDQSLTMEFAATDYADSPRNRYVYKLEGFDTGWVDRGAAHQATYTNLDPGRYRFLVKGCNNEGLWTDRPLVMSLEVIPPFWKTLWFKSMLLFGCLGGIYSVYSMRLRALKARRRELEETVANQTASLRIEIQERVKTEDELRESQQSFQAIFQYSPLAVAISSRFDSRMLQVNNAFCTLTGYPAEEILGRNAAELGMWEDMAARKKIVDEVIAQKAVLNRELGIYDHAGRRMHVLCSAALIDVFDEPCILWLLSDITERKNLEMELVDARERAEAASQAKSDFLANVSHEIRSPLSAILGLTELSLRENPPERLRVHLEKVTSASHVLLGVINDLLDLSKIEAGKMELCPAPFSLKAILDRLADIYVAKAGEKGLGFTVSVQDGLTDALVGDSLRLEQVLINLAGNAVKFTNQGQVEVDVAGSRPSPGMMELAFSVRDTGIGMTKQQLERIFNPFIQAESSTSRRFGGTGLGLSIVHRLVVMMGGDITVRSEPDQGSAFSFTVVFEEDAEGAACQSSEPGQSPGISGVRALVVDDNDLNRELTVELLKMAGALPEAASSGHEALEMLDRGKYDVALLDVQMPVMDGYELARTIRNHPSHNGLVLLALTAHAMSGDKERCLAAGMNGYLTKPIMPEILFSTLRRKLGLEGAIQAASN